VVVDPTVKYQLDVRGGPGTGEYASGTQVPVVASDLPEGTVFIAEGSSVKRAEQAAAHAALARLEAGEEKCVSRTP
jgi:hypothetical protein